MRFSVNHPLVTHPHEPDLASGRGLAAVAAAAEAAGRDPGSVDVGSSTWRAVTRQPTTSTMGVTWARVGLPSDSVEHAVEVAAHYGEELIARA